MKPSDYIFLTVDGTTFSGEPVTTLFNTFRNILYISFFVYLETGRKHWLDPGFFIAAAGDDGICTTNEQLAPVIYHSIVNNTSRSKHQVSPLGQCIDLTEIKYG